MVTEPSDKGASSSGPRRLPLVALPPDVMTEIASFCNAIECANLAATCRRLNRHMRGVWPRQFESALRRWLGRRVTVGRVLADCGWNDAGSARPAAGDDSTTRRASCDTRLALRPAVGSLSVAEVRGAAVYFDRRCSSNTLSAAAMEHRVFDEAEDEYVDADVARTEALLARFHSDFEKRLRLAMSLVPAAPAADVDAEEAPHMSTGSTPDLLTAGSCKTTFPLQTNLYTSHELDVLAFLVGNAIITRHQVHESPFDHKRALIVRLIGPSGRTAELRYFAMLRLGSFPCFRTQLLWLPGSWTEGDILSDRFQADLTEPGQLFAAGFGRVEMDICPKLFPDQLQQLSACLDLGGGYPLELLWNAIALTAVGDAMDEHHTSFEFQYHTTVVGALGRTIWLRSIARASDADNPSTEAPVAVPLQDLAGAEGDADDVETRTPSSGDTPPSLSTSEGSSLTSDSSSLDVRRYAV